MLVPLEFVDEHISGINVEIKVYMDKLNSPVTTIPVVVPAYGAIISSELGGIHQIPQRKSDNRIFRPGCQCERVG